MNLEGQLQGGGHLSVPRWPEAPPLGASCQARSGAPHTYGTAGAVTPRSRGTACGPSTFSHRSRSQGSMVASGLQGAQVHAGLGPCSWLGPAGGRPLPHSPQLVLVIAQTHGQEGAAPQLQQPAVQLLGHKVKPVERRGWHGPRAGGGRDSPAALPGVLGCHCGSLNDRTSQDTVHRDPSPLLRRQMSASRTEQNRKPRGRVVDAWPPSCPVRLDECGPRP